MIIEGLDHFQTGENPEGAIELAPGGNRIEVTAGHHRWQTGIEPCAARKNISHVVDFDTTADLAAPADEQVAPGAILVGQRQPARAAMLPGSDLGHRHDAIPQAFAVDLEIFDHALLPCEALAAAGSTARRSAAGLGLPAGALADDVLEHFDLARKFPREIDHEDTELLRKILVQPGKLGVADIQDQAVLDVISGKVEPSGLLPHQMPANMATVEKQMEDVPFDMEVYTDGEGNSYDFGFGLNWSGVIQDERTERYQNRL